MRLCLARTLRTEYADNDSARCRERVFSTAQMPVILGRSPHDLAVLRGFVDVAAEFEPGRAGPPSLARFLRERE